MVFMNIIKFYGKGDNYPFFIAHMPALFGNNATFVLFGSILPEILRIAKFSLKLAHLSQKLNKCF